MRGKHPWLLSPIKPGMVIDMGGSDNIRIEPKSKYMTSDGRKGYKTKIKKLS